MTWQSAPLCGCLNLKWSTNEYFCIHSQQLYQMWWRWCRFHRYFQGWFSSQKKKNDWWAPHASASCSLAVFIYRKQYISACPCHTLTVCSLACLHHTCVPKHSQIERLPVSLCSAVYYEKVQGHNFYNLVLSLHVVPCFFVVLGDVWSTKTHRSLLNIFWVKVCDRYYLHAFIDMIHMLGHLHLNSFQKHFKANSHC